jgi:predicted secreted protein
MRKRIIGGLLMMTGFFLFAGDVARFVDIGFSTDGKTYFFGQYGKIDNKFLPYAEIYAVDVKKNDFSRTFKADGTSQMQNGNSLYEELLAKNTAFINASGCTPVKAQQILYLRESESKSATSTLEFQDFARSTRENPLYYSVRLVPNVQGSGKNVQSSFYIIMERKNGSGGLIDRAIVGNPDIKRSGVLEYRIEKIFTDAAGKSLVFVVEKILVDGDSVSVRYMVETIVLNENF